MCTLNTCSHPAAAEAIRAASGAGVRVILATGKARPAAIRAAEMAGLAGMRVEVWMCGCVAVNCSLWVDEAVPG